MSILSHESKDFKHVRNSAHGLMRRNSDQKVARTRAETAHKHFAHELFPLVCGGLYCVHQCFGENFELNAAAELLTEHHWFIRNKAENW